MASAKARCATCGKGNGVCKCEGCSQKFCEVHFIEHRGSLKQQLDNIADQRNTLQDTITENDDLLEPLIGKIDIWENEGIKKVQHAANEARNKLRTLIEPHKREAKRRLDQFTKQLSDTREDGGFDERDLTEFIKKLKKLQTDLNSISSLLVIRDESNTILVAKLAIANASEPIERTRPIRSSSKSPRLVQRRSFDDQHDSVITLSHRSSSEHLSSPVRGRSRPPSGEILPSVGTLPPVRARSRCSSGRNDVVASSFPSPYPPDRTTSRERRRRLGQLQ